MLDFLGEKEAAAGVEAAVARVLSKREVPSLEAGKGPGTREMAELVLRMMAKKPEGRFETSEEVTQRISGLLRRAENEEF